MNKKQINIFKENKSHGTLDLPINTYDSTIYRHFDSFCLHWHEEMELIFVRSGRAAFNIDFERYDAKSGDLVIVPPNAIHCGVCAEGSDSDCDCDVIVFHYNFVRSFSLDVIQNSFLAPIFEGDFPAAVISPPENKGLSAIHGEIMRLFKEKPPRFEMKAKAALLEFFAALPEAAPQGSACHGEKSRVKTVWRVKTALDYIYKNYESKVEVTKVADLLGYDVHYFCRFFRQAVGESFVSYLNSYRIGVACQLLLGTERSVTDIALDTGFEDVSYFIRVFKKQKALPPLEYRRRFLH